MAGNPAPPKVYLAGPEVFVRAAVALGAAKVEICARYGLEGKYPLDGQVDVSHLSLAEQGYAIARANEALMLECHAGIANLTPFRAPGMDVGTAYEVGFMRGHGKPVFGYTNSHLSFFQRVRKFNGDRLNKRPRRYPEFRFEDDLKMGVEQFEFAENLMIESAISESRAPIVRRKTKRSGRYTDLSAFEECVKQAAAILLK
ncbi:MAG TPA: nucleoside 2-deoxyribosyltransferase [Alphaproteobacteria bacterium]|nr:nucleoside 2-deoxyribosyltransferase [Alphaproteobacteria bacterium]